MRILRRISAVCLLLSVASSVAADTRIDADRLPINLQRIRRQLRPATMREEREGLNLRYFLQIYGEAPRLKLFAREENLTTGAVPYGAPTHQDFMTLWTPHAFRTPPVDFNVLLQWLAGELSKKKPDDSRTR